MSAARNARSDKEKAALDTCLREMRTQGGGLMNIAIIDQVEGMRLLLASALGNPHATKLLQAVAHAFEQIDSIDGGGLCLTCPAILHVNDHPLTFALIGAHDGSPAIVTAMCPTCADYPDRNQRIVTALRAIWPDAREVQISDQAGHSMNRAQRRRFEAMRRQFPDADILIARDRSDLIRIAAAMAEADPTVSGATIIAPDGSLNYLDARLLRQGGRA